MYASRIRREPRYELRNRKKMTISSRARNLCPIALVLLMAVTAFRGFWIFEVHRNQFEFFRCGKFGVKEPEPLVVITVPHILWFTYETNILLSKEPAYLFKNVLHTIDAYNQTWMQQQTKSSNNINPDHNTSALLEVRFLDDQQCLQIIEKAYPDILIHFAQETNGAHRGDICRVAALYLNGGYYFDVDMEVVNPYIAKDRIVHPRDVVVHHYNDSGIELSVVEPSIFISSWAADRNSIFQSFVASTAHNPILKEAFQFMMAFYENRNDRCIRDNWCLMGTVTMHQAYQLYLKQQRQHEEEEELNDRNSSEVQYNNSDKTAESAKTSTVFLLDEDKLIPELYPEFPRRPGVDNFFCSYVVHDPTNETVHFYSRIVGSKNCPYM